MLHLDPGETVILEVRKHWFVFMGTIIGFFIGILAPLFGYLAIFLFTPQEFQEIAREYKSLFMFFYYIWFLAMWITFFLRWTDFYLDVWYVTQKRIIDVEQKSLFHREIANLRFDKIQDISIEVKGVVATMLNFGDIQVQTAGEDSSDFFLRNAKNPERVRKVIFSQHNIEAERPRHVTIEPGSSDQMA